jgi:hypothetical protein
VQTFHTEDDVIRAYQNYLRYQTRQMEIEKTRLETQEECDERLDAMCEYQTIELQYIAQFTY